MIAAHKAESENEEACDKVRARSAMTTESVEGQYRVGEPDCQNDGCPHKGWEGQPPHQHPK